MDASVFDRMARRLATGSSRRRVVSGAVAAAGSALVAFGPADAANDVTSENCVAEGKRCGRGKRRRSCKKCCTKNVITDQNGHKRCSCVRLGNGCSNDSQCCEGICNAGICTTSTSPTCVPFGSACTAGSTCCRGICLEGTCGFIPACIPLQDKCEAGDRCCAGVCDSERDVCCIENQGTGCTVSADCCSASAVCDNGTCQLPG